MAQLRKVSRNNTCIDRQDDGTTRIILHNTCVVEFNATHIKLNTGGWSTTTTRTRMNQASNQYGLGYSVSFADGKNTVRHHGKDYEFSGNTITFER